MAKKSADDLAEKGENDGSEPPYYLASSLVTVGFPPGNLRVVCAIILSLWHRLERHTTLKQSLVHISCRCVSDRTGDDLGASLFFLNQLQIRL